MPKVTFVNSDGKRLEVQGKIGETVLDLAHEHGINLEGACEGSMACSTCHVIVENEFFERLDPPSEDEEDMLDLAFDVCATSRLGCQVTMTKELDGLIVTLPSQHFNFARI